MAKRILAVDDERHILRLIEFNLKAAGWDVTTAENGLLALESVAEAPPDLILLDWSMPELDGIQTLQQLKGNPNTEHIPVVMLTAKSLDSDVSKGWTAGVDAYLTKPFNPRELLDLVDRLLNLDDELLDDDMLI